MLLEALFRFRGENSLIFNIVVFSDGRCVVNADLRFQNNPSYVVALAVGSAFSP